MNYEAPDRMMSRLSGNHLGIDSPDPFEKGE